MKPYPYCSSVKCEGVQLFIDMDGSKEQTLGKFHHKLMDAHCELKQTEHYSP